MSERRAPFAEHHRNDVKIEFVQQSRCQVLLRDLAAAPKHYVFAAGGLLCLFERGPDSVGDQAVRGPSLHHHGILSALAERVLLAATARPPGARSRRPLR